MEKKRKKTEKDIDPELIRHFMLGGVDFKDTHASSELQAEVDLHLDDISGDYDFRSDGEKLQRQLQHLEKQIDRALASGKSGINVIHGKGEGKLLKAVNEYLRRHHCVRSFRLLTGKKHDGGATAVFFK